MKLSQFKFKLPEDSIALNPPYHRDECRLMVLHRVSQKIEMYKTDEKGEPLKDEEGSISAVLFKGYSRAVSFQLREGMKVFLYGEIAVYEVRGCYQMVVKAALPDGTGDLARRFEELKKGFRRKAFSTRSAKNLSRAFRKKLLW